MRNVRKNVTHAHTCTITHTPHFRTNSLSRTHATVHTNAQSSGGLKISNKNNRLARHTRDDLGQNSRDRTENVPATGGETTQARQIYSHRRRAGGQADRQRLRAYLRAIDACPLNSAMNGLLKMVCDKLTAPHSKSHYCDAMCASCGLYASARVIGVRDATAFRWSHTRVCALRADRQAARSGSSSRRGKLTRN